MGEFSLGFREVIPDQTLPEKWKEIHLNTGGTQSTLQDIKVLEKSGGYCYKDSSKYHTRNRFIYWRISQDVLELVEHSLDLNLSGNTVRYKFQDTHILEGITIHETFNNVVILIATVSSVHRLLLPHPNRIHKEDHTFTLYPDLGTQSIFAGVTLDAAQNSSTFHVINHPVTNTCLPHTCVTWLAMKEEALFALAYNTGLILLIRLDPVSGVAVTQELKQDTLMPRFLSGIAGALRGKASDDLVAVSMVLHEIGLETYLFAVCQDGYLRMWSCSRAQLVAYTSLLSDGTEHGSTQGAQHHVIRKAICPKTSELLLGVFLCYESQSEFCIVKPVNESGTHHFQFIYTINADKADLVDFCLSPTEVWAVWISAQMETVVSRACITKEDGEGDSWHPVILEQPMENKLEITDPCLNPWRAYTNYIFHPGQFPIIIITKALSLFCRSTTLSDVNLSLSVLKDQVCVAVETEIRKEAKECELSDDEYLDLAESCWAKFYACCVHYHRAASKPVGLVLLRQTGLVLVKKHHFSLIRPMDALEHLFFTDPAKVYPEQFGQTLLLGDDPDVCADLIKIMGVLVDLEERLPEETKLAFNKELFHLSNPDEAMRDCVKEMVNSQSLETEFLDQFEESLLGLQDLHSGMMKLVEALTLDLNRPGRMEEEENSSQTSRLLLRVSHLYSSSLGISTVAQSLYQIAVVRFNICRNLLATLHLLLWLIETIDTRENLLATVHNRQSVVNAVKAILMPRIVILTQAYYVVMWVCETPTTYNIVDPSVQRLSLLNLSDMGMFRRPQFRTQTLLELFLLGPGSTHARGLLARLDLSDDQLPMWDHSLLQYISSLGQLVWPITSNFLLPEFLLVAGQYTLIQEYVRQLQGWCEWNNGARSFLLGSAYLALGERHKACDLLLIAAGQAFKDNFLLSKVIQLGPEQEGQDVMVLYLLKVIRMFEQLGYRDCAIVVANEAIRKATPANDPNLSMLHSVVFEHHLHLGHYQEAYDAMIVNPDLVRRKVHLNMLVMTLLINCKLDVLIKFSYEGLMSELEQMVEVRARRESVLTTKYYNFLYALHVNKENYRKAAAVMFERGLRLGQETSGDLMALESQAKCYMSCVNCLRLVEPEHYAWIVRPIMESPGDSKVDYVAPGISPKRDSAGEHKADSESKRRQVEVLEVADVRREYQLVKARIELIKHSPKHATTGSRLSPSELVAVLTNVGLYTTALTICRLFKLRYEPVFEGLTSTCATARDGDEHSLWKWLTHNNISGIFVFYLNLDDKDPVSISWKLLEHLLMTTEEPGLTLFHKAVTRRLCQLEAFLPHWLMASYRQRNPAELLRVLLACGRVADAADLAKDYIWAVLGRGKEYFGLKECLTSAGPPIYLPVNTIDLLLLELKSAGKEDQFYQKLYVSLQELMDYYIDTVRRVSRDKVLAAGMK
uniref:Nuclear pore complex protein n=1 Tax=Timema tahoe TaxID=61484 RepID=A0A7R9FG79_9NEOP|nr:unnamed protein product [Timema tahoe]